MGMQADVNKFVRRGNTALFAATGGDPEANLDVDKTARKEVLELMLSAKANPNHINSQMKTVLDLAHDIETRKVLLRHGAKAFVDVVQEREREVNEQLSRMLVASWTSGCQNFGGRGGGGFGNTLLPSAHQSLSAAAAILKLYPLAPCTITLRLDKHRDKVHAKVEAQARFTSVRAALVLAGVQNEFMPLELDMRDLGPMLRLTMALQSVRCQRQSTPSVAR